MTASSPGEYTGFGRFDDNARTSNQALRLRHPINAELSYDMHDMWRSTLAPGVDTPFACDVVPFATEDGEQLLDLANTAPDQLPSSVQALSYGSAAIVSGMVEACLQPQMPPIDDVRIEKTAILLYGFWDVLKREVPLSSELLNTRYAGFGSEPRRIIVLDRRLILAGISSLFDDQRFPGWHNLHDMDRVRAMPGLSQYAAQGHAILSEVRQGRPVPLDA